MDSYYNTDTLKNEVHRLDLFLKNQKKATKAY